MFDFMLPFLNTLQKHLPKIQEYTLNLAKTAIITYIVLFLFRTLLKQILTHLTMVEEKKKETINSVVINTSRYVLAIILIIAAIKPIVVDLKEVIYAGGIIAAVIGFGAQKLINDVLSGMFMIFEGTIKRGDFIHVNGEVDGGTVEELGFRIIKIRLINGKLVTISNGEIRKMVNGSVEKRRIFESMVISFKENPEKVLSLLEEVCAQLNEEQTQFLKIDHDTEEFVEMYKVYGLHSLDTSPYGYRFSIVATVNDTDYLEASLAAKKVIAQKLYDHHIQMGVQVAYLQATDK